MNLTILQSFSLPRRATHLGLLIVFKNYVLFLGKNDRFLKTTKSFWTFRKRITIVFENYRFLKNDLRSVFKNDYFWKNDRFWKKKIILSTIMLTIVDSGSLLTKGFR